MANNYYTFDEPFIPNTKVRSDEVNTEYSDLEGAFDFFPTETDAINRGTVYLGTESGSGNSYDVTLIDTRLAYLEGDRITFRATHGNTGSSSISLDGLGYITAVRPDDSLLESGDIVAGVYYEFIYDSAENHFQMFNQPASFLIDMDARVDWAEEWAINPEDDPISAAAGGSGTDFSSLHWATKSSASAAAASSSESNAADSESNSADNVDYSQEWAINPEDTPVSVAAGGDGSSTFSSLHWSAKAEGWAAGVNLPVIGSGDAGKGLVVNSGETGYDLDSTFAHTDRYNTFIGVQTQNVVAQNGFWQITCADAASDGAYHGVLTRDFAGDICGVWGSFPAARNAQALMGYTWDTQAGTPGWNLIFAGAEDAKTLALTSTDITYNGVSLTAGGDLVDDLTPQLGGDLDVQGFSITTSVTDGNIKLVPPGAGVLEVDELRIGQWASDDSYAGMFRADGAANSYMIMANTATTHISSPSATGTVAIRGGNNNSTNAFIVGNGTGCTIGGNEVWHAGNDGSGSGLDADKVDGYQSSLSNVVNTVTIRDSAGDLKCRLVRGEYTGVNTTGNYYVVKNSIGTGDNYHRNISKTNARNDLLSASSVSQSRLKTATAAQSSAISGSGYVGITRTGGNYQLSGACGAIYLSDTALGPYTNSSNPNISVIGFQNLAAINGTVYYTHRYVQASPPYNLGDGDVPMFIQLLVDRATGEVVGHSVAPDPIWANNGPTNCHPEVHNGEGVGFVHRKDGVSKELMQRAIRGDDSAMEEIRNRQTILVEVDDSVKNADMNVVPHCWVDVDLSKYSVVTIDPVGPIGLRAFDLMEVENDAYMEFAELLAPEKFEQYFILDNTPIQRNAPILAPAHSVRWKLT